MKALAAGIFGLSLAVLLAAGQEPGPLPVPPSVPRGKPVEQVAPADTSPTPIPIPEIIQRFAAKEKRFEEARDNYTYRQSVKVQELDFDNRPAGSYEVISDVVFTPEGKRYERVIYEPMPTLKRISISQEDRSDIQNIQPFVLTPEELPYYTLDYLGKQPIDELNTYLFRVTPKKIDPRHRLFQGVIWVDDQDFQIVKTYGKAVPDLRAGKEGRENLFPLFETYREQIDGKYWFPTYTRADDTLDFKSGPVRIRMIIRYSNYKQFKSDVKITYGSEAPPKTPEELHPEPNKPPH
jgi:hypothetical protein